MSIGKGLLGDFQRTTKRGFRFEAPLIAYISLVTFISVFSWGFGNSSNGAVLTSTAQELFDIFGLSDSGSFLRASIELEALGGLTSDKLWVINLWPPGMVWLNAYLSTLFGNFFGVSYAVLTALTWSALISYVGIEALRKFGVFAAFTFSSLVLVSSPFQSWIFGWGLFYAEGFSTAAYLSALIFLIKSSRSSKTSARVSLAVLSGTLFAIAAYFRASYSLIESLLLVSTILVAFITLLGHYVRKVRHLKKPSLSLLSSFGAAWLAMFILMEPWLRFVEESVRYDRSWTVVSGNFFRGAWVDRSLLPDFLASGGGGWACIIDRVFCKEVNEFELSTGTQFPLEQMQQMTVFTALGNPLEYLADRFHFMVNGWFSNEGSMGAINLVWGTILFVGLVFFLFLALKVLIQGEAVIIFILATATILALPLFVGHIEPRYFIPIKLLVLLIPFVITSPRNKSMFSM